MEANPAGVNKNQKSHQAIALLYSGLYCLSQKCLKQKCIPFQGNVQHMGLSLFLNHNERQEGHMLVIGGGGEAMIKAASLSRLHWITFLTLAVYISRNPISPEHCTSDLILYKINSSSPQMQILLPCLLFVFPQSFPFFLNFSSPFCPPFAMSFFSLPLILSFFVLFLPTRRLSQSDISDYYPSPSLLHENPPVFNSLLSCAISTLIGNTFH